MQIETILVIQTLAIIAILVILILIILVLKKEVERLKNELETFKKEIKPTIDSAKKLIENANKITELGIKGAENAVFAIEKFRDASIMIENLCLNVKSTLNLATGKVSLFKLGVQKGLGVLVSHYIKKKEVQK